MILLIRWSGLSVVGMFHRVCLCHVSMQTTPRCTCLPAAFVCSLLLDSVYIKNRPATYSQQSGRESCFWDTSETCHSAPGGFTGLVQAFATGWLGSVADWGEFGGTHFQALGASSEIRTLSPSANV